MNSLAKEFRFYPIRKGKPLSNFKEESELLQLFQENGLEELQPRSRNTC